MCITMRMRWQHCQISWISSLLYIRNRFVLDSSVSAAALITPPNSLKATSTAAVSVSSSFLWWESMSAPRNNRPTMSHHQSHSSPRERRWLHSSSSNGKSTSSVDTTRNDYDGHQAAATTTTTTTTSTTNTAQKKNSKKQPEPRRSDRPGEKSKKKPNKQERLRNRPGFNSYLKVVLDETALQFLHDTTADIVRSFHEKFPLVEKVDPEAISTTTAAAASTPTTEKTDDLNTGKNEDDKVNMETNESSSNIKNDDSSSETKEENNSSSSSYILKIKPRSFDSLHMTLFFGGEVLCKLPAEALTEWHSQITTRLAQSGFQLEKNYERTTTVSAEEEVPSVTAAATEESTSCTDATKKLIIPPNTKNPEYSFRITKICTFPLRRNNLIVAILEATPEFYQLHDDIRAVAATSSCKDLKQIVKCSKNIWTPHITLANILKPRKSDGVGGKKRIDFQSQMKMLEDILAQYSQMEEITLSSCVTVSGIAMGGPMPQQAELDFDFQYHNPR